MKRSKLKDESSTKIFKRLLETRLEEKSNRKTEKVRKDGNRRIGNCD